MYGTGQSNKYDKHHKNTRMHGHGCQSLICHEIIV